MTGFIGNNVRWPYNRAAHPFVVRVIEPSAYKPDTHADLFNAVLTELLTPQASLAVDQYDSARFKAPKQWFDLVTFPEAFVPAPTLVRVLSSIVGVGAFGCIHVGLRPDDHENHLFSVNQIENLIKEINDIPAIKKDDLAIFSNWLSCQEVESVFNIGCLFLIDANNDLRVCLHPKIVRSKFEANPLPEHHMKEADLLTLVTLEPTDKRYMSITLQPLLCSDALDLPTDQPSGNPIAAVNNCAEIFGAAPPDHVDVVTVATCTPQPKALRIDGSPFRQWHDQFLDTFRAVANKADYVRHHFAAVILSNFATIQVGHDLFKDGGVSGGFFPIAPAFKSIPPDLEAFCWGRPKKTEGANMWSVPDDMALTKWDSRGFVLGLNPYRANANEAVRIFAFTIQRLPRQLSLWSDSQSITKCEVSVGRRQIDNTILFGKVNANAV